MRRKKDKKNSPRSWIVRAKHNPNRKTPEKTVLTPQRTPQMEDI